MKTNQTRFFIGSKTKTKKPVMRNVIVFIFLLFNLNGWSQNIIFEWNKILGTKGANVGLCIRTDADDFIYTAGCFSNSIDFLGTPLTSLGKFDAYLAKMDAMGELIWIKQFSGAYNDKITSLEIDKDNNIYVCGSYRAQISFDTTLVTNNVDTRRSTNMFIAKFNSEGKLIWAKNTGGVEVIGNRIGPVEFGGNRLTIDNDNNLIVTGESIELDLFDTLEPVNTIDSAYICDYFTACHWEYFQSTYNFLAKYSLDGEKIWIKQMGGCPYTVKTDNNNNIIISGYFKCWSPPCNNDFDGIHLDPISGNTIFLVKYDPNGNALWAQTAAGSANYNVGYDVVIDDNNDIYLIGQINCGNIQFGSNIHFSVVGSNANAFLTKIDNNGDFKWAKILGNPKPSNDGDWNSGNSVGLTDKNIFVTGYFKGSLDIDGSEINAFNAMIVEKLDYSGNILKAGIFGSSGMGSSGKQLTIDKQGNIYVTGYTFQGATSSNDPAYIYIAKIGNDLQTSVNQGIYYDDYIDVCPNPFNDNIIIQSNSYSIKTIQIFSDKGNLLYSEEFEETKKVIDGSFLGKGIYFAKINCDGNVMIKKLIKQ
ncbi:MAG TPA: T9SS type A sorting domain-containing protein [Prolixibacteraceae bacterium]|nr:T9SS type A sorting domain-containing protein [Prolixibacteraceae bacterium]